jgi:hypothetical protein
MNFDTIADLLEYYKDPDNPVNHNIDGIGEEVTYNNTMSTSGKSLTPATKRTCLLRPYVSVLHEWSS